jgi:hypothetical protein
MDTRADLDVQTLLKLVLVWVALEVLEFVLGPLTPLFGLVVVVLIVLRLLDRI